MGSKQRRSIAVPTAIRAALPGILLVMFLGALDQTVMAAALPTVAGDLHGLDQMPTIITAYLVAATAAMPLTGKLGDAFGRKLVLQASLILFVVGAVLCGLAQSVPELIAFRAVQGLGGGGLLIGGQAIIGELVSPRERGRFLGIVGVAYIAAAVVGPLAGGAVVDSLSWRWIFYGYVPAGLTALAVVSRGLHLPAPPRGRRIDYGGAALLGLATVAIILLCSVGNYAAPPWLMPVLAAVAAASVAGWVLTARLAADPIVPLSLFRDPAFTIPTAISFLLGFAMFAATSAVIFLRQVGSAVGVAGLGSLITVRFAGAVPAGLTAELGDRINSLTPKMLAELPAADRSAVAVAFGQALPPAFGYAAVVLAIAFVLTLCLPERELRTMAHSDSGQGISHPNPRPQGASDD